MHFFKGFCLIVFLSVLPHVGQAQTREPNMGDLLRQMQTMIQQFQDGSFDLSDMQGDSTLGLQFFKIDTSMFSDPMFKTMPNMEGGSGLSGMQDFFKMFEGFGLDGFDFGSVPQTDDGTTRTEEDLLPEEQLRVEEEKPAQPTTPQPSKKAAKKPERKTTRI